MPSYPCFECRLLSCNVTLEKLIRFEPITGDDVYASHVRKYTNSVHGKAKLNTEDKSMSKAKEKSMFISKKGTRSPILSRKHGESEEDFMQRMTSRGYPDLDKVEKHFNADKMQLHAGSSDRCPYCVKQSKANKSVPVELKQGEEETSKKEVDGKTTLDVKDVDVTPKPVPEEKNDTQPEDMTSPKELPPLDISEDGSEASVSEKSDEPKVESKKRKKQKKKK
jgi:hypothetical protein